MQNSTNLLKSTNFFEVCWQKPLNYLPRHRASKFQTVPSVIHGAWKNLCGAIKYHPIYQQKDEFYCLVDAQSSKEAQYFIERTWIRCPFVYLSSQIGPSASRVANVQLCNFEFSLVSLNSIAYSFLDNGFHTLLKSLPAGVKLIFSYYKGPSGPSSTHPPVPWESWYLAADKLCNVQPQNQSAGLWWVIWRFNPSQLCNLPSLVEPNQLSSCGLEAGLAPTVSAASSFNWKRLNPVNPGRLKLILPRNVLRWSDPRLILCVSSFSLHVLQSTYYGGKSIRSYIHGQWTWIGYNCFIADPQPAITGFKV